MDKRPIANMISKLKGQICRPWHIDKDNPEYRYCMDNGLVKFVEWPSGVFIVTDAGRDFLEQYHEEQAND